MNKPEKIFVKNFPQKLNRADYFKCPVWTVDAPEFVDHLNKSSDKYIEIAKKNMQKEIDTRNNQFGNKGDRNNVYHSKSMLELHHIIY